MSETRTNDYDFMTSTTPATTGEPQLRDKASSFSLLLFLSVIVLFIAARLWQLTTSCLWFDEIFSIHAARHDWRHMFQFVAADLIHPPLFYALLKIWIAIGGESPLWLRLLPVLCSVAAIAPFVMLCRALKLTRQQITVALLLLAVNGYLIKYAQEVRMYSLLFFLTCTSLWLVVRFSQPDSKAIPLWLALTLVNLLLVYSHYAGWIVVFFELFFIMFWRRERATKFRLTVMALIVAYLPWLYLMSIAKEPGRGLAQNIGWVTRPGPGDLIQFFASLNIPFLFRQSTARSLNDIWSIGVSLLVIGVPLAFLVWKTFKNPRADTQLTKLLLFFALSPVVLVFALSWVLPHSVWGSRHLIIVAVPYAILVAIALTKLSIAWLRTVCLILVACWVMLNGAITLIKRPPTFTWCTWEPLSREVVKAETGKAELVQIYAFEDLVAYHLWFALAHTKQEVHPERFKVHVVKGVPGLREDPAFFLPRRFYEIETQDGATIKGESIWLAFRDAQFNAGKPPLSTITAQGFEIGRIFELRAQGQESFLVEMRRAGPNQLDLEGD
jgi:uncharacterized membrane protein